MIYDIERILGDTEYREEMRYKCQTDHFFLAPLLGYNKFLKRIHQPVADLYVAKKPGLPIEEQHEKKKRMHLDPRETFKTTFGIVDDVQWVIGFPDITIVTETATQPLAKALVNVSASKFYQPRGKGPTAFQACFPEYVVDRKPDGEYNAPCRTMEQPDMTLAYTSVKTAQSGWHPWIFNPDDAVDTLNSGITATDEVRRSVISIHNTNINTLRRGGYMHVRGTRYHPFDLYGDMLRNRELNPDDWKVLIRGSLKVKNGVRLTPGEFPAEKDIELLMPEILTYKELKSKFDTEYQAFMCQQMNDPQGGGLVIFPPERYGAALVPENRVPQIGEVLICWRLPYVGKEFMARWAEGVAARIVAGKVYIIDAWRGMYTPSGLAEKVIEVCRKHQTGALAIEQTPGTEYAMTDIQNEAARKNRSVRIEWLAFEEDDGRRVARMQKLEPMMAAGRLLISLGCGQGPELKRQFEHFGMTTENGLVDTISRLALRIPASVIENELEQEQIEAHAASRRQGMYDLVFGQGGMQIIEEAEEELPVQQPWNPRNDRGLPNIFGDGFDG